MTSIIVLVEPSHPGNIGAVARAMKTMGLLQLRMVKPKAFPHPDAEARASGAVEVLKNAVCYDDLRTAINDCKLILATSNRARTLSWPVYSPEQAAKEIQAVDKSAIIFGRESSGLTNDELNLCNAQVTIPTFNKYQSLNLSHAVQIITYALANTAVSNTQQKTNLATSQDALFFKEHLQQTLSNLSQFHMPNPQHTLDRIFCLINRAQPNKSELNLLRGILSAVDKEIIKG